ncbi:hypothetical protein [Niabella ginsengisoli]|uniref:Uncharacterized protein n=1 Tax=Niabella ginsengisoli TaxID=522298 RepID=A0ABS9SQJ9_9BACT|nr:hypothetical protein [Niabella ginsengisoli]MCH5600637.1 hypothetical protein [Niabella ginsengisoli]
MKQALLVVNALLVIAVSYLLYKQFTNSSDSAVIAGRNLKSNDSTSVKTTLIAY